jgi:PKD repeat protein
MRTHFSRLLLVCLVAVVAVPAFAAGPYANPADFTGQGTTANGSGGFTLNTQLCGTANGAEVDGPYLLWVLTATGADNAEITGPWGTAAMTQGPSGKGAFKFVSAYYDLSTLTPGVVSATYDGDLKNAQLVISHGCKPACTTPATPVPANGGAYCIGPDAISIQLAAGVTADSYSWTGPNGFTSSDQNPTDAASAPGSYTYSLTVTVNGCTSAAGSTIVVVNAIPATPAPSNDGPHCFTANPTSAHLSANTTADSYSWSGPDGFTSTDQNPTVSLAAPGSYTYSLTVTTNGCSSAAGSTTVVINPLPDVAVSAGGPTTFCVGGSVTLTANATGNGDFSYLWSNGATSQSITVGAAGSYSVTVTDANGCPKTSAATTVITLQCACALTQGAYGSAGGAGTISQVSTLIGSLLTAGLSPKSFSAGSGDAPCLVLRLPAGGTPAALPSGPGIFTSGAPTCGVTTSSMLKNGKFNNVLLGQTITLTLNVRGNASLAGVHLCPSMTTQHVIGVYLDPNSVPTTFAIPSSVLTALGPNATVGGLLNMANQALGGTAGLPPLSDINAAVNNINVGFDGCRALIACN